MHRVCKAPRDNDESRFELHAVIGDSTPDHFHCVAKFESQEGNGKPPVRRRSARGRARRPSVIFLTEISDFIPTTNNVREMSFLSLSLSLSLSFSFTFFYLALTFHGQTEGRIKRTDERTNGIKRRDPTVGSMLWLLFLAK